MNFLFKRVNLLLFIAISLLTAIDLSNVSTASAAATSSPIILNSTTAKTLSPEARASLKSKLSPEAYASLFGTSTKRLPVSLNGQSASSSNLFQKPKIESCFDYYHFQSVQVSVGPENQSYKAGEVVRFVGNVINQNPYPVVDGYVFVRIGEKNPNYVHEGQLTVDEFIALGPIAIDASSSLPVNFTWNVPKTLKNGSYKADYFFSVGKRFNLGGLPFTNEIIIGFSEFNVSNGSSGTIVFDRSKTLVNGNPYLHIGNWPEIEKGSQSVVTEILKNPTNTTKTVNVQYNLYWWDSLNPEDKISSKTETVTIGAKSTATLTYTLPSADKSVYYLKITATTADGEKSIDNVRILVNGISRPRANYPAVTQFPIPAGAKATLFSCYHDGSNSGSSDGKLVVTLKDKDGNDISNLLYTGMISGAMSVATTTFTAPRNLTYLNLEEKLYDKDNNLIESYNTTYDCSVLNSKACNEMLAVNWTLVTIIIVLSTVILLVAYFLHRKNPHPHHRNILSFAAVIALIGLALLAIAYLTRPVWAETVSADGKTKGETGSVNYYLSDSQYYELLVIGWASHTNTVSLIGNQNMTVGQAVSFNNTEVSTFDGISGDWDSPYFGENLHVCVNTGGNTPQGASALVRGSTCQSGGLAYVDYTIYGSGYFDQILNPCSFVWTYPTGSYGMPYVYGQTYDCSYYTNGTYHEASTSISVVSSNSSVLQCSGMTCIGVGPGTASVSVNVASIPLNNNFCMGNTADDSCGGDFIDPYGQFIVSPTIPGSTFTWTITVTALSNTAPIAPVITGPTTGYINTPYSYTFKSTDPQNDQLMYEIDWNKDGTVDASLPSSSTYTNSGTTLSVSNTWSSRSSFTFQARAKDTGGNTSAWTPYTVNITNRAPTAPVVTGPTSGNTATSYSYTFNSTDPDNDNLYYTVNWGDGNSNSTSVVPSGTTQTLSHSWNSLGTKNITVTATDNYSSPQTSTQTTYSVNIGGSGAGSLTGTCTVPSSVNIPASQNVTVITPTITTNASSPYTINPTTLALSPGVYSNISVKITEQSSGASLNVPCNAITVTGGLPASPISLGIGETSGTANYLYMQVARGTSFALKWNVPAPFTSCPTESILPASNNSTWSNWINGSGTINSNLLGGSMNLDTDDNTHTGSFRFNLTCTYVDTNGFTVSSSTSVTAKVFYSSGGEI